MRSENGAWTTGIRVLGLLANEADRRVLENLCAETRWSFRFMGACQDARAALDCFKPAVVLFDRDLPGAEWRQMMKVLAASPQRACIILLSRVVDDYLWDEVVRSGGYDVLPKPLREDDVLRAVRLAWCYWNSSR